MSIRYLINNDGSPFESAEIRNLRQQLDALSDHEREEYRNQNASAIAQHDSTKCLIVSGPGTGKSHLFLNKIDYWYKNDPQANVVVTSFVRKLVADLQNDIESDDRLSTEQKSKIRVLTLHKFARSIVEKNNGTSEWPFRSHFRIIGQFWKEIVWKDVLAFYSNEDKTIYSWEKFEEQLHNRNFKESDEWRNLKETYFKLCKFYNAVGFADLILRAKDALAENPDLSEDSYFIIDEFQDFNLSEEALINQLVNYSKGLLVVGDDEQVLYEKLKSGKPTLIRNLYKNKDYANGMLPFCGRSSFHITKSAGHFIQQQREIDCIEKIYLPIKTNEDNPKVQVIACATAPTAVDYIERFVDDNRAEIDERKRQLSEGYSKDAFLLILTPAKGMNFYGQSKEKIRQIVTEYQAENRYFSEDYYKILSYYSLANDPRNNFTFRKVLYYEDFVEDKVHELIEIAMQNGENFCDLDSGEVKNAQQKCNEIKTIIEMDGVITEEKIDGIARLVSITNKNKLKEDILQKSINQEEITKIDHEEEESELGEIETKKMGAVELMTIVGSKGLSADNVILIGFDNVNMNWVTKNAFYVAMTRARKSLHIITALKSGGAQQSHSFLNQLPDDHAEFYSYKKTNHSKNQLNGKQGFKNYLNTINSASRQR